MLCVCRNDAARPAGWAVDGQGGGFQERGARWSKGVDMAPKTGTQATTGSYTDPEPGAHLMMGPGTGMVCPEKGGGKKEGIGN